MNIAVVGFSHKTAGANIRERVAFSTRKKQEAIQFFLEHDIDEVIIVSTCNRSEIYFYVKEDFHNKIELVKEYYQNYSQLDDFDSFVFTRTERGAVQHLFEVSAGLDSMIVGEDEILGQVKRDHALSLECGGSKKVLNKLFREAITTSKKIKSEYKISENPLSTSYIGIKLLKEKMGSLENKKAMIIGLGEIGLLTLKYLIDEGLNEIFVTNRTHKKALELDVDYSNLTVVNYTRKSEYFNNVDFIITATAAPHYVIHTDEIPKVTNSLHILDLAIPRDVETDVSKIENVNVSNIDDLRKVSIENESKRLEIANQMKELIEIEIEVFSEWYKNSKNDHLIQSLQNNTQSLYEEAIKDIVNKLSIDDRELYVISKVLNSTLKKATREAILSLKQNSTCR